MDAAVRGVVEVDSRDWHTLSKNELVPGHRTG